MNRQKELSFKLLEELLVNLSVEYKHILTKLSLQQSEDTVDIELVVI